MMELLIKTASLAKGMVFAPLLELNKIKKGEIQRKLIYYVFIITMIVAFIRASFAPWCKSFSYYDEQYLNEIVNFINYPYMLWIIEYLSYLWGLFLIIILSKLFKKGHDHKELICLIMSISVIGIIAQIIFLPMNYLLPKDILRIVFVFFRIWNILLLCLAIKVSLSISYFKSILIMGLTITGLIISTFGLFPFMSPYLLFIQYH